jgi:hypothetical protein
MAEEKRRRGRPRSLGREIAEKLDQMGLGHEVYSVHGKLDNYFLIQALGVLTKAGDHRQRWPWLFGPGPEDRLPRRTVLSALGRVGDEAAMVELADGLCTGEYKATEVVRRIRAWKLNRPIFPAADAEELAQRLLDVLSQYITTHDGLTMEIAGEASEIALAACREYLEVKEDGED